MCSSYYVSSIHILSDLKGFTLCKYFPVGLDLPLALVVGLRREERRTVRDGGVPISDRTKGRSH